MIDENPNNPLFLKKYAQFLFQSKRDLEAAENYYSRAVSADPSDGETIFEYATLLWELHHDQEKALSLYEQAVQATPGDRPAKLSWFKFCFN
ncbi:Tetratricopeptide repeat (TPR) superfamily protein [Trifolium repens]|nr:Tetratricopeptide repeat (TPR) superfamily protein [Trifolium repens]